LEPQNGYTGWLRAMPEYNGNPCWIATTTAISNTSIDIIETTDWTIQKLVEDG
jgi:hypothetical protein